MQKETLSKKYQNEIDNYLYDSNILKHWQLIEFDVKSLYLNGTLEDVKTYWNQDARFREGFEIDKEQKIVSIPNFFVKIDGVLNNENEYKKLITTLSSNIVYKNTPKDNMTSIFEEISSKGKAYCKDELEKISQKIKKHKEITIDDLQSLCYENKNLLQLNDYISKYILKKINLFIQEKGTNFDLENILILLANMNINLFKEFQNWDFAFQVPKITIINESSESLNISCLEFMDFLNYLGFDIIFFSPIGETFKEKPLHYQYLNKIVLDKFIKIKTRKEIEDEEYSKNEIKKCFALVSTLLIFMGVVVFFLYKIFTAPVTIYTLSTNISKGTEITKDLIIEKEIEHSDYIKEYITNIDSIIGKVAIDDMKTNTIFTSKNIMEKEIENDNTLNELKEDMSSIMESYKNLLSTVGRFSSIILILLGAINLMSSIISDDIERRARAIAPMILGIMMFTLTFVVQIL